MNLYERFGALVGRKLRTVGTCVSSAAGESVLEYPGGGRVTVRGIGTPGTRYFAVDGRLDGEASSLTPLTIEI